MAPRRKAGDPPRPSPQAAPHQEDRIVYKILGSLALPLAVLIARPFGFDPGQSALLAGLALAVTWWAAGIFEKWVASLLLLAVFFVFGRTPASTILRFPLSRDFPTVVLAFLFSQGISRSGLAEKLLLPVLDRRATGPVRLLAAMILSAYAFVFLIPQPFSRAIILTSIFAEYFRRRGLPEASRERLSFAVVLFSVIVNMSFLRGDIVLNPAFLRFAEIDLTEGHWAGYMLVPTLAYLILTAAVVAAVYRRDLGGITAGTPAPAPEPLSREDRRNLAGIVGVVLLWATEDLHGIDGIWIVAAGTAAMFTAGLLRPKDWRAVNPGLLVFLTAAFSIGGVMKSSGTASVLIARLGGLLPGGCSWGYLPAVAAVAMGGHMVFGSNMTTLSLLVPSLVLMGAGCADPLPAALIAYVAVCSHFVFPYQSVLVLLGVGERHYRDSVALRFAPILTILAALAVLALYLPWWRILGLI